MSVFRKEYRELTEDEKAHVENVKTAAEVLYDHIEAMKDGREKSIAKTKLEESVMWAVKGITG